MVEQAAADCAENDEVEPLLEVCRRRYREVAGELQAGFLLAIQQGEWPPEGLLRQTQTFDRHVAPVLQEGGRVVYFLVDAMRYEMARDLGTTLEDVGSVKIEAAAGVMRTIGVSFQHWRHMFSEATLTKYGSPYFAKNKAGAALMEEVYTQASRVRSLDTTFTCDQIICGNEAFPEAAVADSHAWSQMKASIACCYVTSKTRSTRHPEREPARNGTHPARRRVPPQSPCAAAAARSRRRVCRSSVPSA